MAYNLKVDGMEQISELLDKMEQEAPKVAAGALYEGAGIMADEIRKGAESIQTAPFHYAKNGTRLPSPEEKAIVTSVGAGIARFSKNGTEVDTSVGYRNAGYAELNGKKKPIPVIVNSINSGTSFMKQQPFVRKAKRDGGTKAMARMQAYIENAFEKINEK